MNNAIGGNELIKEKKINNILKYYPHFKGDDISE